MTNPLSPATFAQTALTAQLSGVVAASRPSEHLGTLVEHLGAITPAVFDGFEAETVALFTGVAVNDLGWLRQISVTGSDRERWLNGMVTNAVLTLQPGEGNYNFLLNAQGRILGDLDVWKLSETDLRMTVATNQYEAIFAHLDHFIIMDDVEMHPVEGVTALGVSGPKAASLLVQFGLPIPEMQKSKAGHICDVALTVHQRFSVAVPSFELWVRNEDVGAVWNKLRARGALPVGVEALNALRIAEGIPAYGSDIPPTDLPQETSQLHALNFTKGCYLGQEIVERIRSRGAVHRHIRQFELKGELPKLPTTIFQSGKSVGELTSAVSVSVKGRQQTIALGHLRDEALLGDVAMEYDEGSAVVLKTSPLL